MLDPSYDDIELKITLQDFLKCFNNPKHVVDSDSKTNFWIVPHNKKEFVVYEWWKYKKLYVQAKHGAGTFSNKAGKCKDNTETPQTSNETDTLDLEDLQSKFEEININGSKSDWSIPAYYNDLQNEINKSPYKRFIKNIDLNKEMKFEKFSLSNLFTEVANITRDSSNRKTVLKFDPLIELEEWYRKDEWIYIFLIAGYIVKIGGTRNGLAGRTGSYLCGHHTSERGGSDKCSITNAYIYNTFDFYLSHGFTIKMMGFRIPPLHITTNVFGKEVKIIAQTYHTYESVALEIYKQENGSYPFLSNNADPDYKN